jgi:hypothetical protein
MSSSSQRTAAFVLLGLLSALPARAQDPRGDNQARGHELTVRTSWLVYRAAIASTGGHTALGVDYRKWLSLAGRPCIQVGGGVLTGTGPQSSSVPLEAHVVALLTARLGRWQAAAGPELGVSGFTQLRPARESWREVVRQEQPGLGPVYVAFNAEPLRLDFGRLAVSALQLQVGTGVAPWGYALRLQLGFLRVGYSL